MQSLLTNDTIISFFRFIDSQFVNTSSEGKYMRFIKAFGGPVMFFGIERLPWEFQAISFIK